MMSDKENRLPSVEKPWMKWHVPGAGEKAAEPCRNETMYQFLSHRLREQGDKYPAFSYFGKKTSRSRLLSQIDRWARMLRGMGVVEDDKVVVFVPFSPEAASVILALNKVGAWPILINLGSSEDAISQGCANARFAIVCDAVESRAAHALRCNRDFEQVILISVSDDMPFPMRLAARIKGAGARRSLLREAANYVPVDEAFRRWGGYKGETEAACVPDRPAIVTSSSGTTKSGYAKLIMDSNASVVSMIKQTALTTMYRRYTPGSRTYTGLPPFISTSILVLFLLPLCYNATCYMDPRMDPKVFIQNVLKFRPQVCLITGRCWVHFFTHIEREINRGVTPDLSFFSMPIMGGDGITVKDLRWMNSLLRRCGSRAGLMSGYGMSEMFSVLSFDARKDFAADKDTHPVISVGVPMPGAEVCIMDRDGNELGYEQRGEICVRGTTLMLGYYNDIKKTQESVRDGWFHSEDIGSISEDGHIYLYGRMSSCYKDDQGRMLQPFDLENFIGSDRDVRYCMVNNMAPSGQKPRLAVHLVLRHHGMDKGSIIKRIDAAAREFLGGEQIIQGYKVHRHIFRMNQVLKIDRRYYKEQISGYVRPEGSSMINVEFDQKQS